MLLRKSFFQLLAVQRIYFITLTVGSIYLFLEFEDKCGREKEEEVK